MQTLKFKTSLKCNGCVSAIKPKMDAIEQINTWRIYLDVQDKTLEVDFEDYPEKEIAAMVEKAVKEAGYSIEKM